MPTLVGLVFEDGQWLALLSDNTIKPLKDYDPQMAQLFQQYEPVETDADDNILTVRSKTTGITTSLTDALAQTSRATAQTAPGQPTPQRPANSTNPLIDVGQPSPAPQRPQGPQEPQDTGPSLEELWRQYSEDASEAAAQAAPMNSKDSRKAILERQAKELYKIADAMFALLVAPGSESAYNKLRLLMPKDAAPGELEAIEAAAEAGTREGRIKEAIAEQEAYAKRAEAERQQVLESFIDEQKTEQKRQKAEEPQRIFDAIAKIVADRNLVPNIDTPKGQMLFYEIVSEATKAIEAQLSGYNAVQQAKNGARPLGMLQFIEEGLANQLIVNQSSFTLNNDLMEQFKDDPAELQRIQERQRREERKKALIDQSSPEEQLKLHILMNNLYQGEKADVLQRRIDTAMPLLTSEYNKLTDASLAKGEEPASFSDWIKTRVSPTTGRDLPGYQEAQEFYRQPAPVFTREGLVRQDPSQAEREAGRGAALTPFSFIPTDKDTGAFQQRQAEAFQRGVLQATPDAEAEYQNFLMSPEIQRELQAELDKQQAAELDQFGKSVFNAALTPRGAQPFTEAVAEGQAKALTPSDRVAIGAGAQERTNALLNQPESYYNDKGERITPPRTDVAPQPGITPAATAFTGATRAFTPTTNLSNILAQRQKSLRERFELSPSRIFSKQQEKKRKAFTPSRPSRVYYG